MDIAHSFVVKHVKILFETGPLKYVLAATKYGILKAINIIEILLGKFVTLVPKKNIFVQSVERSANSAVF